VLSTRTNLNVLCSFPRLRQLLIPSVWMLGQYLCAAQCPVKVASDHTTLSYEFSPVIDGDATTIHVRVTVQGAGSDRFVLRMPGQAGKDTVSPWINLRSESTETIIDALNKRGARVVHFRAGNAAVFSYDLQKNWSGSLSNGKQFNPLIFPTYFELFGRNTLARPQIKGNETVTANFDWRALPTGWTLATSFGAGSDILSRCQSFTGLRDGMDGALFAGGDFRLHTFKVGQRDVELAIRGTWSFSDEEAENQLRKPIQLARAFWHDENFPYFLVILAPWDEEDTTEGSGYTNAFWFFMSPKDVLSRPLWQKDLLHEAFHEWEPRRMGVLTESQQPSDWFREGITDYYADLLAYRGGLLSRAEYAQQINRGLTAYANGSKSPYDTGLVLGLWLDSVIRQRSGGKQSLDDVMFEMVRHQDQGFNEDRVLRTLDEFLTAGDSQTLRRGIQDDAALPWVGALLATPCLNIVEKELAIFELGLNFEKSKADKVIAGVDVDGPAYLAGLRDGQKLLSWSVEPQQTDELQTFTVKDADIQGQRKLSFYSKKMVMTPQLSAKPKNCVDR